MKAFPPGTPLVIRLAARVQLLPGDSCWHWTGYIHPRTGYGLFTIKSQGTAATRRRKNERSTCRHGHPYDERNTAWTRDGYRRGRRCSAESQLRSTARRKEVAA